jgi:hypothetical protein
MQRTFVPSSGLHNEKQIPSKVQRNVLMRTPHKRRICQDNRNYVEVPFTIPGAVQAINYGPMWRADRDYWIAKITANVGRHDTATHPNDGTPGGLAIRINMRRVSVDLSSDAAILTSDLRLVIAENHHQDAVNDEENGRFDENDFNLTRLAEGQHIYPRITQIGTTRPGTGLVVTAVLVPIP